MDMILSMFAFQQGAISIMVGFLVFCICVAIVIILGKWILSLIGLPIPQPVLVVLGLIVFLILLLLFLNWAGFAGGLGGRPLLR